jgi:small subunit ribosomal protein S21
MTEDYKEESRRDDSRRSYGSFDDSGDIGDSRGNYGDRNRGGFRSGGGNRFNKGGFGEGEKDKAYGDRARSGAMEVVVDHSLEKAMKILKRKLIKEGLFKELKSRRYYEKPSERKKRKLKESMKKIRKEEARARKNALLY